MHTDRDRRDMNLIAKLNSPARIPGCPGLSDWLNAWKGSQVVFVVVLVLVQFLTLYLATR